MTDLATEIRGLIWQCEKDMEARVPPNGTLNPSPTDYANRDSWLAVRKLRRSVDELIRRHDDWLEHLESSR